LFYPSSKIRPCPSFLKTWGVQDASEILDIGQVKDNEKASFLGLLYPEVKQAIKY